MIRQNVNSLKFNQSFIKRTVWVCKRLSVIVVVSRTQKCKTCLGKSAGEIAWIVVDKVDNL